MWRLLFHRYKLHKLSKGSEDSENYANIRFLHGKLDLRGFGNLAGLLYGAKTVYLPYFKNNLPN